MWPIGRDLHVIDHGPRNADHGVIAFALFGALWMVAVTAGVVVLQRHASTPGAVAKPPETWPDASSVLRAPDQAVIVMLAHPGCPCTRASIAELAELMARVGGRAAAHVLFLRPDGVDEDWERGELWRRAATIPGVTVHRDVGGVEAARFRALTSGEVIVYGADGRLLFRGGITDSRGHAGDNPGRRRIVSLLAGDAAARAESPVFGCPLNETGE